MWLYADIKTLGDIPRYYAKTKGAETALIKVSGAKVSWNELNEASNRMANLLLGLGVTAGAHVSFLGKNAAEYFEVLFGANKIGCGMLALNWRLSAGELAVVVEDAKTPIVFVDKEYLGLLADIRQRTSAQFIAIEYDSTHTDSTELREKLAAVSLADPGINVSQEETAVLLYTSGTTGKPKGVQITHKALYFMRLCEHNEPAYRWEPNDVMVMIMPNFHLVAAGLSIQALYNGVPLTIVPMVDIPKLVEVIQRDRATVCCLVPTAIQMVIDHPAAKGADFSSLRLIWYAGSPIALNLLKRALAELKCKFMQFYGATETCGAATLLRPEQHDLNDEAKLKSCGTPLPFVEIKIVDPNGKEVADGEVGEFLLRSPSLFGGYWGQPEVTAAAMEDGWYHTGDGGYRDKDGLLYIVDRMKDMIVSGGENIYSIEVESALSKHPAVSQVSVIGVPDERWGEKVTAIVVLGQGKEATEEELQAHCRSLIAGYKVPKQIIFQETLPMTPSGKILKTALRKKFWEGQERAIG